MSKPNWDIIAKYNGLPADMRKLQELAAAERDKLLKDVEVYKAKIALLEAEIKNKNKKVKTHLD